jgi:hypothetical protein
MNPPPIGEALGVGWERLKENPMPIILAVLCAGVANMIPFLGMPGLMLIGAKASRGQTPEIGDAFVGFQKPVDHIMIGLLQISGMLACCIGVYATQPMFYHGYLLVHERNMTWQQAKDLCLQETKPTWLGWTIYWFVMSLVASAGVIACVVGVIASASVAVIALGYAYDQTLAKAELQA